MNVQIPAMGSRAGKVTLNSLARELGVSRQTVSNVVNSPHVVKPETRARVQAAIERSGYRPSSLGRALRTQRSMNLGLRVHPMTNEINGTVMDRFLHALAEAARAASYRITIFTALDDSGEYAEVESLRAGNAIDGCILTNTSADDLRPARLEALGCPFVAFGRPWSDLPGTHAWVDVDGAAGTEAAARMLAERGHTRIGFIGWGAGSGTGDDRRAGWERILRQLVDDPSAFDVRTDDGVPQGAQAARTLRTRGATALVCASDSLAFGAFPLYAEAGDAFVPVVGFDDTPVARAVGLSSVAQPVEAAASFCVRTLVGLLSDPNARASDHQELLTPTLAVRERAADCPQPGTPPQRRTTTEGNHP